MAPVSAHIVWLQGHKHKPWDVKVPLLGSRYWVSVIGCILYSMVDWVSVQGFCGYASLNLSLDLSCRSACLSPPSGLPGYGCCGSLMIGGSTC